MTKRILVGLSLLSLAACGPEGDTQAQVDEKRYPMSGGRCVQTQYVEEDQVVQAQYVEEDQVVQAQYVEEDQVVQAQYVEEDAKRYLMNVGPCPQAQYVEEDQTVVAD